MKNKYGKNFKYSSSTLKNSIILNLKKNKKLINLKRKEY